MNGHNRAEEPRFVTPAAGRRLVLAFVAGLLAAGPAVASDYELGFHGSSRDYGRSLDEGDPISMANGAFSFQIPLLPLGGPADLDVYLDYRSDRYRTGQDLPQTFWWGPWAYAASGFVVGTVTQATVYLPSGGQTSFWKDGADRWQPAGPAVTNFGFVYRDNAPRYRYDLRETADYLYFMDPDSQRVFTFQLHGIVGLQKNWRLVHLSDRNGNALSYTYTGATGTRITRIEDGLGRFVDFTVDPGALRRMTDHGGRSVAFGYVTNAPDNGADTASTLRAVTNRGGGHVSFQYGGKISGLKHLVAAATNPAGTVAFTQAYGSRMLFSNDFPRVLWQTDAAGHTSTVSYSSADDTVGFAHADGAVQSFRHSSSHGAPLSATDASGDTVGFEQDANGHLQGVADRLGGHTRWGLHPDTGYPSDVTNAMGGALRYDYLAREQTFTNAANGETVTFTFHDLVRVDHADGAFETFAHDGAGNITSRVDAAGAEWRYAYDNRGQVLLAIDPLGGTNRFTYNADGTLAEAVDADGGATSFAYDALKRRTGVALPGGARLDWSLDAADRLATLTNELGGVWMFDYDANGNLVSSVDPAGHATTGGYDAMDRLVSLTNRLGAVTVFGHDSRGRLNEIRGPDGVTQTSTWDPAGRTNTLSAGTRTARIAHDAEGRPVSVTDPAGAVIAIGHDELGNRASITDPLGRVTTLGRDARQRVVTLTDSSGQVRRFGYDAAGRLATNRIEGLGDIRIARNALGAPTTIVDLNTQSWTFAYTPAGRLRAAIDPTGRATSNAYDAAGRLAGVSYPDGTTAAFLYDAAGSATNRTWSAGPVLEYAYDAAGRLVRAGGVTLERDAGGRVTNSASQGVAFGTGYDAADRLTRLDYADGLFAVTYEYDATNGWLSAASDTLSGTRVTFEYDAAGRLAAIHRPNGVDAGFEWDAAGQLVRLRETGVLDLRYSRDPAGRVSGIDATVPLTVSAALSTADETNAYDAASRLASAGVVHDMRGRLTARPGLVCGWDGASRLVAVNGLALDYDALGRLVRRSGAGPARQYFHTASLPLDPLVAERDEATGNWRRFYVWTPDGALLYMIDAADGNKVRHYHFDGAGSTLAMTDATGAVVRAYAYAPDGRLAGQTGSLEQPFSYGGRHGVRQEGSNGLFFMRARWYDSVTGRFLSPEPLWPQFHEPLLLNPYAYAMNDPVSGIDPTGLAPEDPGLALSGSRGTRETSFGADLSGRSLDSLLRLRQDTLEAVPGEARREIGLAWGLMLGLPEAWAEEVQRRRTRSRLLSDLARIDAEIESRQQHVGRNAAVLKPPVVVTRALPAAERKRQRKTIEAGARVFVVNRAAEVRRNPNKRGAADWQVGRGAELEVLDRRNGWLLIADPDGARGWIHEKKVSDEPAGDTPGLRTDINPLEGEHVPASNGIRG